MKNLVYFLSVIVFSWTAMSFTGLADKWVTQKSHIKFFSSTPAEDIEAHNYKSTGTLDKSTGDIVFSVPMQSFEFEKALMQKHFNQDNFLDTKKHPKAKLVGKITNLSDIDFNKNGTYTAQVTGDMTIKGKTNPFSSKGKIKVEGQKFTVDSKFNLTLSDYGVEFVKGKPSKNIAKTVEVTIEAVFSEL